MSILLTRITRAISMPHEPAKFLRPLLGIVGARACRLSSESASIRARGASKSATESGAYGKTALHASTEPSAQQQIQTVVKYAGRPFAILMRL